MPEAPQRKPDQSDADYMTEYDKYRANYTKWYNDYVRHQDWEVKMNARRNWEKSWSEWDRIRRMTQRPDWAGDLSFCCNRVATRFLPTCNQLPNAFFDSMCLVPRNPFRQTEPEVSVPSDEDKRLLNATAPA